MSAINHHTNSFSRFHFAAENHYNLSHQGVPMKQHQTHVPVNGIHIPMPPPQPMRSPVSDTDSDNQIVIAEDDQRHILAERFKTKVCRNYVAQGFCPYEQRCMFAHGDDEMRTAAMNIRDGLFTEEAIKSFKRAQRLAQREEERLAAMPPPPPSYDASMMMMSNNSPQQENNSQQLQSDVDSYNYDSLANTARNSPCCDCHAVCKRSDSIGSSESFDDGCGNSCSATGSFCGCECCATAGHDGFAGTPTSTNVVIQQQQKIMPRAIFRHNPYSIADIYVPM